MSYSDIHIQQGWPTEMEAMAQFLDQNMEYDTITAPLLREKLLQDPQADPQLCFTATVGGKTAGFLFCVRRSIRGQEFGYVKLMAVDKNFRRKGIGSRMYLMAEKVLTEKGAIHIRWYDVPLNYLMPGLDPRYTEAFCFASRHGFKQFGEAVNMRVDLNGMDWDTRRGEDALKEKGVEVRRATLADIPAIRDLLSNEWQLWNNEVDMAMQDDPPSVHIAFISGKLRAFSVHNGNNKGTGWFGPMGTHPDMRGLGMGSILLKRCLEDMRRQGHKTAIIPWVAPIAFYSHYTKARIERVFWRMEKVTEEPGR
ncbi:MAG: GNAT family N-acetyltransferase [Bacteroidota bacterium]